MEHRSSDAKALNDIEVVHVCINNMHVWIAVRYPTEISHTCLNSICVYLCVHTCMLRFRTKGR
jgi:hypothetical protein